MNPRNFTATQAAFLHCEWPSADDPDPFEFPDMLWATNYTRLAASTLSVLFFAGRDYAPKCIIDGKNIQDWMQEHFIAACRELAIKIRDAGDLMDECVIGWDSMNEPNGTYIGLADLDEIPKKWQLRKGPMPTPLQSFRLGTGQRQTVQNWFFGALGPKRTSDIVIDPKGKLIWNDEEADAFQAERWGWKRDKGWPLGQCLWSAHGVWDQESGELRLPDYFAHVGGPRGPRPVDFVADYWLPHWRAYAAALRPVHREAIMFLQPPVFEPPPHELTEEDLQQRACISAHFYDGLTLITKHWNWFNADAVGLLRGKYPGILFAVRVGNSAIRQCMRDQLGYLRADTLDVVGRYPTMIGEIGIPFDLDNKKTYFGSNGKGKGVGDYTAQTLAMDASLNACDGNNLLSFCLWTYCADNTHLWGDGWNGEDLSIWSLDDIKGKANPTVHLVQDKSPDRVPSPTGGAPEAVSSTSLLSPPSSEALASSSSGESATGSSSSSISGASSRTNVPRITRDLSTDPKTGSDSGTESGEKSGPREPSPQEISIPALTNGSRAAPAFCRPFPVATLGSPISIDFEIKTSVFRLTIEVEPEDLEDENLPTEIYVPFVHYAADPLAGAASGNFRDSGKASPARRMRKDSTNTIRTVHGGSASSVNLTIVGNANNSSSSSSVGGSGPASASASSKRRAMSRDSSSTSSLAHSTHSVPVPTFTQASKKKLIARSHAESAASSTSSLAQASLGAATGMSIPDLRRFALDLDVQVSSGRWEVEDQYLRWYLPADAANTTSSGEETKGTNGSVSGNGNGNGNGKARHTITIKRGAGPLLFDRSGSAWELLCDRASSCGLL